MSERDIVERLGDRCSWGDARLVMSHGPLSAEAIGTILRLRAELATARREGWIAGRDAAAVEVENGIYLSDMIRCMDTIEDSAKRIRNMEPPT